MNFLTVILLAIVFTTGVLLAMAEDVKMFDLGTIRPEGAIYDIDAGGGKVYVPDLSSGLVIVLNEDFSLLNVWKDIPSPHGVAVGTDGTVYVGTHRSGSIKKFDANGTEIPDWDLGLRRDEMMKAPVALTIGLDRNIYVCDWIMQRVIEITIDGKFVRVFDDAAIKAKGPFQPHGLAVDAKNKRMYVADRGSDGGNGLIHIFSLDGQYIGSWPKPTSDFDPMAIRPLTEGLYIVPNYSDGAMYIFDAEGRVIEKVDVKGNAPGKFMRATSVVADKTGFLYVPELEGNRVQKVDFRLIIKRCVEKLHALEVKIK